MGFFGSQIPISEADSDAAKAVFMSTEAWAGSGQSSALQGATGGLCHPAYIHLWSPKPLQIWK